MKTFISFSVLLNVLLLGIIIGGFVKPHMKPHLERGHNTVQFEQRFRDLLDVLPPEKSKEFERRIVSIKALKHSDRMAMREARKNIMRVFTQEPFEKSAYQEAVRELNSLHQKQMAIRVNLMVDMAQYLSSKERKQLSRLMMNRKGPK